MVSRNFLTSDKSLSLRRRLLEGVAWSIAWRVPIQGSTLVINLILANLLGSSMFGQYALIYTTVLTVSAVGTLGLGGSATKYIAEFRLVDKERTGRILGLCSATSVITAWITGIALFVCAPWIAEYIVNAPGLTLGLRIGSGVAVFVVLNGYAMSALAGLESFPALGVGGISGALVLVSSCAIGALLGGVNGATSGLMAGSFWQWAILAFLFRRERARHGLEMTYRGIEKEWQLVSKYFIPSALSGFVAAPVLWLGNVFLAWSADGLHQVALYTAANNIRACIIFLPQIVNGVAVSLINTQVGLRSVSGYRRTFWLNLTFTALPAVVGATGVMLLSGRLLAFFGKAFVEGRPALVALSLAAVAEALIMATYQVAQSRAEMWRSLFMIYIPTDITIVVLAYAFAPRYGAAGLAWAYALGCGVALLTNIIVVYQLGLRPEKRTMLPSRTT